MPFSGPDDDSLPDRIKEMSKETREKWVGAWNGAFKNCRNADTVGGAGSVKDCEGVAFKIANTAVSTKDKCYETEWRTLSPWDKENIPAIEKALSQSDLGLSPVSDGNIIRIPLPRMSSTQRDELVKVLKKKHELTRVNIRNVRNEVLNQLRAMEKSKDVSEDHARRLKDELQKATDEMMKKCDVISDKKEKDITSI